MTPIARIRSDFPDKFGVPRQSGLVDALEALVVFEPAYRDPAALRGQDGFSHLWLLWEFSRTAGRGWSPTVRPPRLGGNARLGVFATRSPFRPNPIGLSCVRLAGLGRDPELGPVLRVAGADLADGTPIWDIKPYVPYTDCHPEAAPGVTAPGQDYLLAVDIPPALRAAAPPDKREALRGVLAQDPRPAYRREGGTYGLRFAGLEVKFTVEGGTLTVLSIEKE